MNLQVIAGLLFTIGFKVVLTQGVLVSSVVVARNISVMIFSLILLRGKNPFTTFPWTKRNIKFGAVRWLSGQINFILLNASLPLIPLGLLNIVHKTTPFWSTILGYCFMNETILPIEVIGMIVCFVTLIWMTYSDGKESSDEINVKSDSSHLLGVIFCLTGAWLNSFVLASNRSNSL